MQQFKKQLGIRLQPVNAVLLEVFDVGLEKGNAVMKQVDAVMILGELQDRDYVIRRKVFSDGRKTELLQFVETVFVGDGKNFYRPSFKVFVGHAGIEKLERLLEGDGVFIQHDFIGSTFFPI